MRKSIFASIRCALKTTNEPLDVIYNVLVGCYIPLCNNDLKGEPLDNEGVMRKSFRASIRCACALQITNEPSHVAMPCLAPTRFSFPVSFPDWFVSFPSMSCLVPFDELSRSQICNSVSFPDWFVSFPDLQFCLVPRLVRLVPRLVRLVPSPTCRFKP